MNYWFKSNINVQNSANPNFFVLQMEPAKKTSSLVYCISLVANLSYTQRQWSLTHLSIVVVTNHFFYRSYTISVINHFVTVNCWSLFSHLPQSLSLIIDILQIIHTFWHCSILAHLPLSSQSLSLIIDILQIIHSFLTLFNACSPTPLISVNVTDQFILQIRHRFWHLITFLFHR